MANSLSQYIAQIRQQREADMNAKMQAVLPLIEQDIKLGRAKQAESDALTKRGSDYYEVLKQQYGEEKANEWKAGTAAFQTPEAYDLSVKHFTATQGETADLTNLKKASIDALRIEGLDAKSLADAEMQIGSAQSEAEVKLKYNAYGTKILKPSTAHSRGGYGGGGTGGGKVKVDSSYKAQVNRVVHNGYVYWEMNGKKYKARVRRSDEGRVYFPNGTEIDPYAMVARTEFTDPKGKGGDVSTWKDISEGFVRLANGETPAPQQAPDLRYKTNQQPAAKPAKQEKKAAKKQSTNGVTWLN